LPKPKTFIPKNDAQRVLSQAIDRHDIVFAIGPAGCGKTYAACGIAVALHRQKYINQLIVIRPAVGGGENNGYLPGTIEEKLAPYMAPIFDCLGAIGQETYANASFVHLVALEHCRGRTFTNAFVIVDEAQNATLAQLEMVMTRLGEGSKMIITGDVAQSDLGSRSGLPTILRLLEGDLEIPTVTFTESDNLRHPLVAKLTKLFGEYKYGMSAQPSYPLPVQRDLSLLRDPLGVGARSLEGGGPLRAREGQEATILSEGYQP
jgi:phosphate starvation-inducible PhoH-like protein